MSRPPKQKRSERTRRDILKAARTLFSRKGYAETSMEQVAARAGVSRGPLYHYFSDKQDLFRAVFEEVESELAARVIAGSDIRANPNAWEQVRAGNHAFLDACLDRDVQRIAILEAPSVLGGDARRDFSRYGLGLIRSGLQQAIEQGMMDPQPVEPLAHLLRAVLTEGALLIARSKDPAAARAEVGAAIDRLVDGLLSTPTA